jgi:hypothetical protein
MTGLSRLSRHVVSALTGHGDPEILDLLPATIAADRVALVGMHDWTDPTLPAIADEWGLSCSTLMRCGPTLRLGRKSPLTRDNDWSRLSESNR